MVFPASIDRCCELFSALGATLGVCPAGAAGAVAASATGAAAASTTACNTNALLQCETEAHRTMPASASEGRGRTVIKNPSASLMVTSGMFPRVKGQSIHNLWSITQLSRAKVTYRHQAAQRCLPRNRGRSGSAGPFVKVGATTPTSRRFARQVTLRRERPALWRRCCATRSSVCATSWHSFPRSLQCERPAWREGPARHARRQRIQDKRRWDNAAGDEAEVVGECSGRDVCGNRCQSAGMAEDTLQRVGLDMS